VVAAALAATLMDSVAGEMPPAAAVKASAVEVEVAAVATLREEVQQKSLAFLCFCSQSSSPLMACPRKRGPGQPTRLSMMVEAT